MCSKLKRGAFIVFEGCDRSGKSTQSRLLFDYLQSKHLLAHHMVFPDRSSYIGQMINAYLTNAQDLPDESIHLLFTADRWGHKSEMIKMLESGTTLVVDRYSYSGVAYSVAKGLNYDWCLASEKGLLRPDAVFYLKAPITGLMERGKYGEERYEKREFQEKVAKVFDNICSGEAGYWHQIDAAQSKEELSAQIADLALKVLEQAQQAPLKVLH